MTEAPSSSTTIFRQPILAENGPGPRLTRITVTAGSPFLASIGNLPHREQCPAGRVGCQNVNSPGGAFTRLRQAKRCRVAARLARPPTRFRFSERDGVAHGQTLHFLSWHAARGRHCRQEASQFGPFGGSPCVTTSKV
jgi:hypothetical protein